MASNKRYPKAFHFQNLFDDQIQQFVEPKNLLSQIIQNRLKDLNIFLDESEVNALELSIVKFLDTSLFSFDLADRHLASSNLNESDLKEKLTSIIHGLSDEIQKASDAISTSMEALISDLTEKIAKTEHEALIENSKKTLDLIQNDIKLFELRLRKFWGQALDWLEILIGVSMESGGLIIQTYLSQNKKNISSEIPNKLEVLLFLHARACQISGEILALLKTGFADGAHGRWRSLHEVTVIAIFISRHEESVAERYYYHQDIENLRHLEGELERIPNLKDDFKIRKNYKELLDAKQQLISEYGIGYETDYGWAGSVLGKRKPTFRDIEAAVEIDNLRTSYKIASLNVHGTAKGTFERLGLHSFTESYFLAGRSDFGLLQPGDLTAISLGYLTTCLLLMDPTPTIDMLIRARCVTIVRDEVSARFRKAAARMERHIKDSTEPSKKIRKFEKVR